MKDREKNSRVEKNSDVYVHVMITEYLVLTAFEEVTGALCLQQEKGSKIRVEGSSDAGTTRLHLLCVAGDKLLILFTL
ncbi:MAG: hypothetical protein JSR66_09015 [Proteobacteria bacterium]|nr:hypothetical protein [Pseudomonadota bacterium]